MHGAGVRETRAGGILLARGIEQPVVRVRDLEDDLAVGVVEGEVGGKRLCASGVDSAGSPAEVEDHVRQIEREPGTPDVLALEIRPDQDLRTVGLRERSGSQRRVQLASRDAQCRRLRPRPFPRHASVGIVPLRQIDELGQGVGLRRIKPERRTWPGLAEHLSTRTPRPIRRGRRRLPKRGRRDEQKPYEPHLFLRVA